LINAHGEQVSAFTKTIAALAPGLATLVLAVAPMQAKAMVVTQNDAALSAMFSHPHAAGAIAHWLEGKSFADEHESSYLALLDPLEPIALISDASTGGPASESEPDGFYILSQANGLTSLQAGLAAVADPPSSIPEPATFALLLVALAASMISVRRNGDAAAARLAAAAAHQQRLQNA
jgi:hypothetical protein